ncbi:hypothetical protein [Amycolatopsis sp. NPDC051372]|uniref:hypothetical protein n=1 Tax=Amycolatopsis sp. NPDC051372 TaxID=3155669 RepID=UPI00342D5617
MAAVTREQYFEAALGVLAGDGFAGLNVGRLCRDLGVTSGPFITISAAGRRSSRIYWSFGRTGRF